MVEDLIKQVRDLEEQVKTYCPHHSCSQYNNTHPNHYRLLDRCDRCGKTHIRGYENDAMVVKATYNEDELLAFEMLLIVARSKLAKVQVPKHQTLGLGRSTYELKMQVRKELRAEFDTQLRSTA
jgi:hypothetical protein